MRRQRSRLVSSRPFCLWAHLFWIDRRSKPLTRGKERKRERKQETSSALLSSARKINLIIGEPCEKRMFEACTNLNERTDMQTDEKKTKETKASLYLVHLNSIYLIFRPTDWPLVKQAFDFVVVVVFWKICFFKKNDLFAVKSERSSSQRREPFERLVFCFRWIVLDCL